MRSKGGNEDTDMNGRIPHDETVWRQLSMNQEEEALEEDYLLTPWSLTSSLQNCGEKKFCCLTHLKPSMAWHTWTYIP
jgi:hypothetical protein